MLPTEHENMEEEPEISEAHNSFAMGFDSVTQKYDKLKASMAAAVDESNAEYDEMLKFVNHDDMNNKYLKVNFVDPSSALILIQGHALQHLAMGVLTFLVKKSNKTLQCYQFDTIVKDNYSFYKTDGSMLNDNVMSMFYMHLSCFIMLQWSYLFNYYNIHAYHSHIVSSATIFIYIFGILYCQNTISIMNNYNKLGCFPNQMGETVTWLNIEIWVFAINGLVLALYVLHRAYRSLDKVKV